MFTARANYIEPCVCGNDRETINEERIWRILTWKCAKCGRTFASTIVSDSPVSGYYAHKALLVRANAKLREEKKLPPRRTVVTFYDMDGKRITWASIKEKNARWEKRVGPVQRKAF